MNAARTRLDLPVPSDPVYERRREEAQRQSFETLHWEVEVPRLIGADETLVAARATAGGVAV